MASAAPDAQEKAKTMLVVLDCSVSAQAEERQYGTDYDDQAYDIDNGIHGKTLC